MDTAPTTAEATSTAPTTAEATPGIQPTAENVDSSLGEETTFCGIADVWLDGPDEDLLFMEDLLVYVEPDAGISSQKWDEDREFCVTGVVQPADERGSAFITVTDSQQIQ